MTSLPREPSFLRPKEVVLTFDDGPMPWLTKSVLDTLDRFCTKGTFFSVGRMAMAYPATVRDVVARGHTLASHTYSHPFQLPHLAPQIARDEIDRGVAAVSAAAGIEAAPFFRFPGLAASRTLIDYAASRGLVTFTVDVVSNDSYIHDPGELATRTLREIEGRGRGIILFHDIKSTTAKALPAILEGLALRGYKVVHMVARTPAMLRNELMAEYTPRVEKALSVVQTSPSRPPFYGTTGPVRSLAHRIEPEAKNVAKLKPLGSPAPRSGLPTLKPQPAKAADLSPKPRDAYTTTSTAKTIGFIRDEAVDRTPAAGNTDDVTGPPIFPDETAEQAPPDRSSAKSVATPITLPPPVFVEPEAMEQATEAQTALEGGWSADVQANRSPAKVDARAR